MSVGERAASSGDGDTLVSARDFLEAVPSSFSDATPEAVSAALGRVERAYSEFPELELTHPRSRLVDAVLRAYDPTDDPLAAMALLLCVAIWPPSRKPLLAPLLERLARLRWDEIAVAVIRALSQDHNFTWDDLRLAIAQLRQDDRRDAILSVLAEALGSLDIVPDRGSLELGKLLRDLVTEEEAAGDDPGVFAAIVSSARRRVQQMRRRPAACEDPDRLLSMADHVVERLGPPPEAPVELPARIAWPSRQLTFGEFVNQHQSAIGLAIEYLPHMRVGTAGERNGSVIEARTGRAGHAIYGPYCQLPLGNYQLDVRLAVTEPRWGWFHRLRRIGAIEVVCDNGDRWLARRDLYLRSDGEHYSLPFAVETAQRKGLSSLLEFRVWTAGAVPLTVSSITVKRLSEFAPPPA